MLKLSFDGTEHLALRTLERNEDAMIVVTTPTGGIGRQVLANLLQAKSDEAIRVIVRDPSSLRTDVRKRVEVIRGSHGDGDIVNRAFAGADSVFWLVPPNDQSTSVDAAYVDFTKPAFEALKKHGVQRVVGVTALGRGTAVEQSAGYVTASLRMDDLITSTGVSYRALTMPSFMDNLLEQIEPLKKGVFFGPIIPDRKLPSCATRDIAAVAAKLLLDHSWSGVQDVPVLGPEDISFNDMAQIMSDVLGKPVTYQQIPAAAFKTRLTGFGISDAMAQGIVDMMVAKNAGLDNGVQRTPESTTPTTFRQWCESVLKPALFAEAVTS